MCFISQRSSRAQEFLSQALHAGAARKPKGRRPGTVTPHPSDAGPLLPGRPPVLGAENELLGAPFGLGIARRRYCPIGGAGRQLHYAPTHRTVTDGHHQ
jgi:hypothetical protein